MGLLVDPAYVRLGCSDLDASVAFAHDVVGLDVSERSATTVYLRADRRHHAVALDDGPPGLQALGYQVNDDRALAILADRLRAAGRQPRTLTDDELASRKVRAGIAVDDDGITIELVTTPAVLGRPLERPLTRGIKEFEHVGINVTDLARGVALWTEVLDLDVTDWIGDKACLLRLDAIHHKLAMFERPSSGINHVNFQVASLDDVMRQWRRCQREGIRTELGPGRHPTSGAIFFYFIGPDDVVYEYSYGVERLADPERWLPRRFAPEPSSIDMWGGPPPGALQSV